MLKTLPLVLGLLLGAGACKKSDSQAAQATNGDQAAAGGEAAGRVAGKARSGKINLKPLRKGESIPVTVDKGDDALRATRAEQRAERMKEIDKDGDGQISETERDAFRKARQAEVMERLDTNKDGQVSEEERVAAMRERADNLRTRLDADSDGKLTTAELEVSRFKRLDAATIDKDHDGLISTDELAAGMPARGPRFGGPDGRGMGGPDDMGPGGPIPAPIMAPSK